MPVIREVLHFSYGTREQAKLDIVGAPIWHKKSIVDVVREDLVEVERWFV